jgi:alkylation response protein AidB-like acyl-CoA dehydrogenase
LRGSSSTRLIGLHLEGKLDAAAARPACSLTGPCSLDAAEQWEPYDARVMAKYWVSDLENKVVDTCLQLFGGYGYMNEYSIARMFRDSRVQRIYGGANEIMKVLIARTL